MRLVDNIECVLKHAWSLKFTALLLVLDTAQGSVAFFAGSELVSPVTLTAANIGLGLASFLARCVAQEKVSGSAAPGGEA
ncbi:hypothetical protein [Methylobacterium flocculans]|uniref:hypothetical protein n=1 Tax=Methylobacterium flocculans TaxID=2984843 RepID=UPI0021F29704|nr:hypothetical protein [Methylobacterium sp. FF17]